MTRRFRPVFCLMLFCSPLVLSWMGFGTDAKDVALANQAEKTQTEKNETAESDTEEMTDLTVKEARERAQLLHDVYEATLQTMHRHYFREDGGTTVPSSALEEVFSRTKRRSKVNARWLAVNAQAMSIDHKPQDDFEKLAVRALATGKREYEAVEDGVYRHAGEIPLFGSCLKCHAPPPMNPNVNRVAGLVISIPVKPE